MSANGINGNGNGINELAPGSKGRHLMCRGVRGATTVTSNDKDEILEATRELLTMLVRVNEIDIEDVASIYLTTTADLDATYPAFAARQLGWFDLALLCGHEMAVPDGLPLCIRVLFHWNTTKKPLEIGHIYLRDAKSLRPDHHNIPPIRPVQMNNLDAAMKVLAQGL
jgi:chorismate mutase